MYRVEHRRLKPPEGEKVWCVMETSHLKLHVQLPDRSEHWIYIERYFRTQEFEKGGGRRGRIVISAAFSERIARHMPQEIRVEEVFSQVYDSYYQVNDPPAVDMWLRAMLQECAEQIS